MILVIIAYFQIISGKLTTCTNYFLCALSVIEHGKIKTLFVVWNVVIYNVSVKEFKLTLN